MLVVEQVGSNGRAAVVFAYGPPTASTYATAGTKAGGAKWARYTATIDGDALTFAADLGLRLRFTMFDGARMLVEILPNPNLNPPYNGATMWVQRITDSRAAAAESAAGSVPPRAMASPTAGVQPPKAPAPQFAPGLFARVGAIAAQQGISTPASIDLRAPAADAPDGSSSFLGAWGPGTWSGGTREIIVVEGIDRAGNVQLMQAWRRPHDQSTGFNNYVGKFSDRRIVHSYREGQRSAQKEYTLDNDGTLHGVSVYSDGYVSRVSLPRIQ
jgi:hypothetical protein